VVLTLVPASQESEDQPSDNQDKFSFTQGQYLTFRRKFDGEELRRSYSICAGKDDGALQVGIKRVDGGTFSTWANVDLEIGDTLEAMEPMGSFYAAANDGAPSYLAFAGGSGITPILSIIKTGLQQTEHTRYSLVYANRNASSIMFRDELEDLKNTYLNRLSIVHVLEDQSEEMELFRGRVDAKKCAQLFQSWIQLDAISMAYICGPEPMMIAIREVLESRGFSKDRIRLELFGGSQPGQAKKPADIINKNESGVAGQVTLGGETRSAIIGANKTLLEAALDNNVDAPFACKAGVCSTCKARVLKGEVQMRANHALEDHEVEAGFVLTCQCIALSDDIVWDYDQARH